MEASNFIAVLALFVSAISLILSFYFGYRDKVSLKTECKYFPYNPDYDTAHLKIKIVNCGRRPALLTLSGGNFEGGGWHGTRLGGKERSLRLSEGEFHEEKFYAEDILVISPHSESYYKELWFEDSLGIRHIIKGSRVGILKLKNN